VHVSWRLSRDAVLVPVGLVMTAAAVVWLVRAPGEHLAAVNRFLRAAGLFVVALPTTQLLVGRVRGASRARSPFAAALARPIPVRTATSHTPLRDVYLIVLDGHANERVMHEVFGVEHLPFADSLRKLGFVVPRDMRSNYTQTVLSLPSLLNFEHVTPFAHDIGETSGDFSLPRQLIANNRTVRFLKKRGYKYVLFPSAWADLTENSPLADERFEARPGFDLATALKRTELRLAVARSTPLRGRLQRQHGDSLHPVRSLHALPDVAADPAPTFTFAHVLLPHIPYALDAHCRSVPHPITDATEANTPAQRAAYLAQMTCADDLVLGAVTRLLRESTVAPIILIVGDHGSRFTDVKYWTHPSSITPKFARERFGAFGAFYLPDGGAREFGESVTLVNVMRNVLRHYYGADLPPLADDMYVSGEHAFKFYPVDPRWLAER